MSAFRRNVARWALPPLPADSRAALLGLALQILQIVLALASTPILLRHLGQERYSQLAILWAVVYFTPLLDLGMPRVVARLSASLGEQDRGPRAMEGLRSSLRWQAMIVVGALAFLVGAWAVGGTGLSGSEMERGVIGFSAVLVSLLVHNLLIAHLQGRGWLHRMTLVQSVAGLLTVAVPLLLLWRPLDIGDLAFAYLAVRLITLGAACAVIHGSEGGGLRLWRGPTMSLGLFAREGAQGIAYFALAPLVVYGERYLIPAVSGVHTLAAHLIAVDVGLRFLFVPGLVSQYVFRSVAQGLSGGTSSARVLSAYFGLIGPLFVLPLAGVILFTPELTGAWLGAQSDPTTVLCLRLVAVALGACSVAALLVQSCIAAARMAALSRMAVVEVTVYLAAVAAGAWLLDSSRDLAVMASALWAMRLLVNSAVIVRIASPLFDSGAPWRMLLAATLPGAGVAAGALVVEAVMPSLSVVPVKWGALVLLVLVWWRQVHPWAVRPAGAA